ncbi:MAG: 4Fe-4S dicluster domain-containing protein [Chloroflexi bacterium]|jgi:heterodisulfide reductase subunit C|nr:4Fe-4S dicluster domain-containing protein [Chloroflexota bacterium]
MATRVDPTLLKELKKFGAIGVEKCFNCGNCTAICPLTSDEYAFPRNMIRMVQIGHKERMSQSLDPWLCYYCGDCSETCPKGAEPGETMMAARRWLTARYDWTGLAGKFYTSKVWEFGSMILLAILVMLAFVFFSGPMVTDSVELNTFAPLHVVHMADWIMAGFLLLFIGGNILTMYKKVMLSGNQTAIPLSIYISEAWQLIVHGLTQKEWDTCVEEDVENKEMTQERIARITHLLLVSGYGLMLVLIIFFLSWFQTDNIYPLYHPQRWLGYYATIVLLWGAGYALWGRIKKGIQAHRFSHASDWIFPVLLFAVALTGILLHIFRYMGLPLPTYYIYIIHMAFTAPMLILEVPFGKWAHLYYRPLAIYFKAVKVRAEEHNRELAGAVAAAAD